MLKTVMAMANRRKPPRRLVGFAATFDVMSSSFPAKPARLCAGPESGVRSGGEWHRLRLARKDQPQPLRMGKAVPIRSAIPGCAFLSARCPRPLAGPSAGHPANEELQWRRWRNGREDPAMDGQRDPLWQVLRRGLPAIADRVAGSCLA